MRPARLSAPGIWHQGDSTRRRLMAHWNKHSRALLQEARTQLQGPVQAATPRSCRHLKGRGGVKEAVRSVYRVLDRARFVARFDIRGYYDSLRHAVVLQQLQTAGVEPACQRLIADFLRLPDRSGSGQGIVAGCALSPLLGALYLAPLDTLMDQRVTDRRLVAYVRYMDDFVLLADSRWQLRRAIAAVHRLLSTLGLELHPDKRFIGSLKRGFDFLGYRFHPGRRLRPSRESLRRRQTRARRLQEQGGDWQRLRLYALRWWQYLHAGLGADRAVPVSRRGGLQKVISHIRKPHGHGHPPG